MGPNPLGINWVEFPLQVFTSEIQEGPVSTSVIEVETSTPELKVSVTTRISFSDLVGTEVVATTRRTQKRLKERSCRDSGSTEDPTTTGL